MTGQTRARHELVREGAATGKAAAGPRAATLAPPAYGVGVIDGAPDRAGLPAALRVGVEALSGVALDDVRVHYGSAEPARVNAHAFTRGPEIHLGPGQERHLAHEAWHVVQQRQSRVQPTARLRGLGLNDDPALEREADAMGARASAVVPSPSHARTAPARASRAPSSSSAGLAVIQRNAFLTSLANANSQIDYPTLAQAGPNTDAGLLYGAIGDAIEHNRRRQAVLRAIEDENLAADADTYVNATLGGNLGALVSTSQGIRSSHSGGAIDPNLPQAAYEANPVSGNTHVVSVAAPLAATNTFVGRANYAWLADSTTDHTTDPDHPKYRGPTAPNAPATLGSLTGLGAGANQRLAASPNRVASYFELNAGSVHKDNKKVLDGTRVVYDPFGQRYFVSEHYAAQYEIINVPVYTAHADYNRVRQAIQTKLALPAYTQKDAQGQAKDRQTLIGFVYKQISDGNL